MGKFLSLVSGLLIFGSLSASSHFQLQSFSVNSGSTTSSTDSSGHSLAATVGEQTSAVTGATHYLISGLANTIGVDVPNPPTLSNGGGTYYNKLKFTINNNREPSDVTYAMGVNTTGSATVFNYVQADGTIGGTAYYQSYAGWNGASGSFVINLVPSTTYYFSTFVKQSTFGAPISSSSLASIATVSPDLSFSISSNLVDFGTLFVGSAQTAAGVSFGFSTNAANGGYIYMAGSNTGLHSTATGHTIAVTPPSGDLNSLAEGFGISMYGGSSLVAQSPYNTGSNYIVGAIYTTFQPILVAPGPVASDSGTGIFAVRSQNTTPSATDYTNTLTFVAAASY